MRGRMSQRNPYETKELLTKEILDTESRLKGRELTSNEKRKAEDDARKATIDAYKKQK